MKKILVLIILCTIFIVTSINAVILSTERVGFVDLEMLFNEYPGTSDAKREVTGKKNAFELSVKQKEEVIESLEEEYVVIGSSVTYYNNEKIKQSTPSSLSKLPYNISEEELYEDWKSTYTVTSSTAEVTSTIIEEIDYDRLIEELENREIEVKKELRKYKRELEVYVEEREKDIQILEEKYSYNLLGDVYDIILEIAAEQGCSVVIDKNMVLFGEDISDLTPLVIERMRK